MSHQQNFWSSWQERLSALRNVPPILKIVWQSGPGAVAFGVSARFVAALLPVAIGYILKLIIDIITDLIKHPGPAPTKPWWLVGIEFALAVASSLVTRTINYSDAILANKYTRHVSIQVLQHAS